MDSAIRSFGRLCVVAAICSGCAYRTTYAPQADGSWLVTANSRGLTTVETKPDGTRITTVDTSQQGTMDRLKAGCVNLINYLGRALERTETSIEGD